MVVGRVLRDVPGELRDLDVGPEVALERAEEDLSLARLEPVDHAGDGALQVRPREQDQLPVHKVGVADLRLRLVEEGARLDRGQPRLALLDLLLREGELERAAVLGVVAPDELFAVAVDAGEVGLGLLLGRGTETLRVEFFLSGPE